MGCFIEKEECLLKKNARLPFGVMAMTILFLDGMAWKNWAAMGLLFAERTIALRSSVIFLSLRNAETASGFNLVNGNLML